MSHKFHLEYGKLETAGPWLYFVGMVIILLFFFQLEQLYFCVINLMFYLSFSISVDLTLQLPKGRGQNFHLQIFKKMLSTSYTILKIQRLEGKHCRAR